LLRVGGVVDGQSQVVSCGDQSIAAWCPQGASCSF
jgi:hypothetical protein